MQTIVIVGRLSKDAEQRRAGDSDVTGFDVAVDQGYGDRKTTNWFRCQFWGKRGASVQPYLLKGGMVTVSGELETSMYQDKMQLGIRVNEVTLPQKPRDDNQPRNNGGGSRRDNPEQTRSYQSGSFGGFADDDSETPF